MKLQITTTDGETHDLEVDPHGTLGRLEFPTLGGDPDLPARFWLQEIVALEVSEHPQPVTQTPPPPRLKEIEVDTSVWGYTHQAPGEKVRIGPRRSFRTQAVDHAPEPPPAKPKRKPKIHVPEDAA